MLQNKLNLLSYIIILGIDIKIKDYMEQGHQEKGASILNE